MHILRARTVVCILLGGSSTARYVVDPHEVS